MQYKNNNRFVHKIAHSIGFDYISKAKSHNIIKLGGGINFLPSICSESVLDKKHFLLSHYDQYKFILNVSNDSWFENTFGPYQHFMLSKVKAIEYGLPVIRIANTGVSAIIDAYGDVIKTATINTEAVIDGVLAPKLKSPTVYYRIHEYIIPVIFTLYAIFLTLIFIFRKSLRNE